MKNVFLSVFALSFLLSFLSMAFAGTPIKKETPVTHVYAPNGFDTNDSAEIVISGFLPNLCHKSPSATVKIVGKTIEVKVTSLYYHATNPFCPEMVVPFLETVNMGALDRGNYKVIVNKGTQWERNQSFEIVDSSSNSIDEYSYAYVTYIEKEGVPNGYVKLKGYNPSDCFKLDKIEYVHNGKDTYSVLPKMRQISDFCPRKMVPFEYEWKVPEDLETPQVLLHVRSLNGKSVNSVYYRN